jgi:hypothetical protein
MVSYDIMNFKPEGLMKIGEWKSTTKLADQDGIKASWIKRDDIVYIGSERSAPSGFGDTLTGSHLRISVIPHAPTASKKKNCIHKDSSPKCWFGLNKDIMARLSVDLNFTYEFIQPEDGVYGDFKKESKTWSGMIKDILDSRVDLTSLISISSIRSKYIGFTIPLYRDEAAMAVQLKSSKSFTNMFFFLDPFQLSVWFTIFALIAVIAIVMTLLSKLSPLGNFGKKIHAMKTCPCMECTHRRKAKAVKKCTLENTITHDCLMEEIEENQLDDLCFNNSAWLIGTGKLTMNHRILRGSV